MWNHCVRLCVAADICILQVFECFVKAVCCCNSLLFPRGDHNLIRVTTIIHFSHPFLGTYEVVQFLELGNLKGTHPRVVYELHTNPMV